MEESSSDEESAHLSTKRDDGSSCGAYADYAAAVRRKAEEAVPVNQKKKAKAVSAAKAVSRLLTSPYIH